MAKKVEEVKVQSSFQDKAKELEKRFARKEVDRIIIPTGSIKLDKAFGGGYVTGRVFEFIAWEGAGKTSLALHAIASAQKLGLNVAYIDAEHALDRKYAEAIGVDWDSLKPTLFQPMNGEEGFNIIRELLSTGDMQLCVIDSTSGMKPKKEMEDPAGSSNLGLHARLMGQEIPKIVADADVHNCCVIFISQFREKIGVMFGSPETTQGGNALKFWASVRTELRKALDKVGDDVVGIITKFKVIKNKIVAPYQTGEIPITFGVGIDKLEEVKELAKEHDLIRERMGVITMLTDDSKIPSEEFATRLTKDEDFYNGLKTSILEKLNGKE